MTIQVGKNLAASLFLITVPDTTAQASMPQIAVGWVNKANVDPRALRQGFELAAMILRWTGVELVTLDCSADGAANVPPCSGFTGASQISVRLIRRRQKETQEIGFRKLGIADQLDTRPGSGIVYVFCEMTETVAKDRRVPLQDVLGVVIAHEIGHLLISPGHSDTGIMRSTLKDREWHDVSRGMLRFTPRQAEIIREGVIRRNRPVRPTPRPKS